MTKIIKLASGGLAPTMRSGAHERVPATWGVEVDGRLVARIFTIQGTPTVVDATTGRALHYVMAAPRRQNRVALAKAWAIANLGGAA